MAFGGGSERYRGGQPVPGTGRKGPEGPKGGQHKGKDNGRRGPKPR